VDYSNLPSAYEEPASPLEGVPLTKLEKKKAALDAFYLEQMGLGGGEQPLDREEHSSLMKQARDAAEQSNTKSLTESVVQDPSVPLEAKADIIKGIPSVVEGSVKHPEQRAASVFGDIWKKQTETIAETIRKQTEAELLLNNENAQMFKDKSFWDLTKDFAETVAPGVYSVSVERAAKAAGVKGNPLSVVAGLALVGEVNDSIVKKLTALPLDERIQKIDEIDQWASQNDSIVGSPNAFLVADIRDKLIESVRGEAHTDAFWRATDDVLGVVGGYGIFRSAKALFKNAKNMMKSKAAVNTIGHTVEDDLVVLKNAAGRHEEAADDAVKSMEEAASKGEGEQAVLGSLNTRLIGDTESDLATLGLRPKLYERLKKTAERRKRLDTLPLPTPRLLTEEEQAAADAALKDHISNVEGLSTMSVRFDIPSAEKGVRSRSVAFESTYGAPDGNAFRSMEEAQAGIDKLGEFAKDAEVKVFNREDGTWHDTADGINLPEFYVKVNAVHQYDVLGDPLKSATGVKGFFREKVWVKGADIVTSYYKDNGNRINKFIMDAVNVAEDSSAVVRDHLQQMVKPLIKLRSTSKGRVLELLEQGDKEGKNYTLTELLKKNPDLTDAEMEAYYAARETSDTIYHLKNAAVRRKLEAEGHKHYATDNMQVFAKPLQKPEGVTHAVDIETGGLVNTSFQFINDLYASGGHIARARDAQKVGNRVTRYVVVRNPSRMRDIPQHVIRYREGHIHRFYKERWFVKVKEHTVGDEASYIHTVSAHGTKADAEKQVLPDHLQQLIEEGRAELLPPKLDRHLGLTDEGDLKMLQTQGNLITSPRRGEHLMGDDNSLARTEDVITSLEKDIDHASSLFTKGEVSDWLENRAVRAYKEDFNPLTKELLPNASQEAKEAKKFIDLFNGVPDPFDRWSRSIATKAAISLEDKGHIKTAEVLYDRSGFSLAQLMRSTTFSISIAMNPLGQLPLQALQFTMLAWSHPIAAAKAVARLPAFTAAYAARHSEGAAQVMAAAAKAAGMPKDEFKATLEAMETSGLLQSINNHAVLQNMAALQASNANVKGAEKALQLSSNALKLPFRMGAAVGFRSGEAINLATSWLMVQDLWKSANKGKKWAGNTDVYAEWGAKARHWTLNANKMGTFKFQRGLLSTATQFFAFQVKAWLAIFSSPAFTKAERVKMALGMGVMWGVAGGYGPLGEPVWEELDKMMGQAVPDNLKKAIQHGFVDFYTNKMLTDLFGTDAKGRPSDLDISGKFAPLGGIGLIGSALTKEGTPLELWAGMSGYTFNNITNAALLANNIWKTSEVKDLDTALESIKALANIFPVVDHFTRGMMAYNLGKHISKGSLTPGEQIAAGEALGQLTLGIMSRKELAAIEDRMASGKARSDVRKSGKMVAKAFNQQLLDKMAANGGIPTAEDMLKVQQGVNAAVSGMPEGLAREFRKSFRSYFAGLKPEEDALMRYIRGNISFSDDREDMIARIRSNPRFTKDEKEQFVNITNLMWDNTDLMKNIAERSVGHGK